MSNHSHTSLEGRRVRHSFDRAAASYDQAAALQRRVADRLVGMIDAEPVAILDAGSGTGYGTALLRQRFPQASLYALDLAPAMLEATRARVGELPRVCADMQALPLAAASLDLLWSSLMLQWCNHPDLAFAGAARVLQPGGSFVFSTFGPSTLHELRESFADGRTHVSSFPAPETLRDQLEQAGFVDIHMESVDEVLHYLDVRSLMLELKAIGAHNATAGRARGLTGKRAWRAMLDSYEVRRTANGLPGTYGLIYVRARTQL